VGCRTPSDTPTGAARVEEATRSGEEVSVRDGGEEEESCKGGACAGRAEG
jgi:hypothetical protein